MTKYVLANWKSHKNMTAAKSWLEEFLQLYQPAPQLKVIIAPSTVYLAVLQEMLQKKSHSGLALAIQNISPFPFGPYTGEVAAEMVRDIAEFAILGHSERRRWFNETNQDVANKVSEALAADIRPIVCIDQKYAVAQLATMDDAELDKLLIGYGPVEAVGISTPQSVKEVDTVIAKIKPLAPNSPILYGGSINAKNAAAYLNIPGIAGLLVGTASLDAKEFASICAIAAS